MYELVKIWSNKKLKSIRFWVSVLVQLEVRKKTVRDTYIVLVTLQECTWVMFSFVDQCTGKKHKV